MLTAVHRVGSAWLTDIPYSVPGNRRLPLENFLLRSRTRGSGRGTDTEQKKESNGAALIM